MTTKKASTAKPKPKLDPGLLRAHKAYEAAINSNDTDRVMAMYDKDAEILQPDGPLVTGRRSIRKWVNDYFKAYKTHWKKVPLKNFVLGEYGFDVLSAVPYEKFVDENFRSKRWPQIEALVAALQRIRERKGATPTQVSAQTIIEERDADRR